MHNVMSPISSCIFQIFPAPQPRGRPSKFNQAICHTLITATFFCLFAGLMQVPAVWAQGAAGGNIEQNFSNSLTAIPSEPLTASGAFYVPVYSSVSMSQG